VRSVLSKNQLNCREIRNVDEIMIIISSVIRANDTHERPILLTDIKT
jgi:hypothetical protein